MSTKKTIAKSFTVSTIEDGVSVQAQYAPNANPSSGQIHTVWQEGDLYMRTRETDSTTWSAWHRIVGEKGGETDYSFALSAYKVSQDGTSSTAPSDIAANDWQDAPMATTSQKTYLWSKVQQKSWNESTQQYVVDSTRYIRLTGEEGVVYDIQTPVDSIHIGENQTSATLSGTAKFYKKEGTKDKVQTAFYYGIYKRTGTTFEKVATGNANSYTFNALSVANTVNAIVIYLFASSYTGTSPETQTYLVKREMMVVDAGNSPYFADLDNEMDSIACTNAGKPSSEQTVETNVKLYRGSTALSPTLAVNDDSPSGAAYTSGTAKDGITVTWNNTTGNIKFKFGTSNSRTNTETFCITLTVTDNGATITRYLYFTVNCIRAALDGNPAALYRLVPSVNEIVKKKDGTYVPTGNPYITCGVTKNVGGTQSTPAASEYTLKYSLNGGAETTYTATSVKVNQVTSNLVFILYVNGVVVDRETIGLVTDGTDGEDGVSITSADVMFGLSTSETTAPSPDNTTTWKTSIAALSLTNSDKNKYIWQCTKITYSNGNTVYTGKMCLGIVSSFANIVEQYALGTASAATGTWQDTTPPAMANGYYLWTRTKLVYSDNSVSYAPSENGYCVGYYGIDGTSITGANVWYALSSSNSTAPQDSAFTLDNFPTTLNAGYYVWEATKITFSTGSPIFTGKMCLGATSDFLSGTEVYAISTSNNTAPADNQFSTTYSKTKGYYLWTATRVQYTSGSYAYLNKKCVGYWGEDGDGAKYISITGACSDGTSQSSFSLSINDGATITIYTTGSSAVKPDTVTGVYRGIALARVNRSTLALYGDIQVYDTYGGSVSQGISRADALAQAINSTSTDYFVILMTRDACGFTSSNSSLENAIKNCGGTKIQDTTRTRKAFAFIGINGLAQNYALQMQGEFQVTLGAKVIAYIADGMFTTARTGDDGQKGDTGKTGRFFYYAQEWANSSTVSYLVSDAQAPYFGYTNSQTNAHNYWVFNPENNGTYTMAQMGAPSSSNPNWQIMTSDFKYLITQAMFTNFAKLGSAVFSGDWMISQYGTPSRNITQDERNVVYLCVQVDGQYQVSTLATILDNDELWNEYKSYGYTDEELEMLADVCQWAVSVMPNNTDDDRYNVIQNLSNSSYQFFGINSSDKFSVFSPNVAIDYLTGKSYFNDCQIRGSLVGRVSNPLTRIKNGSVWGDYGVQTRDDYGYTRHYLFINRMPTWNVQIEYMDGSTKEERRLILPVITQESLGTEIKIVNVSEDTITVEGKPESSTYAAEGSYLLDGIQITGDSNDLRTIEMETQTMLKFVSVEIPTQYGEYGWIADGEPQTIKSLV